MYRYTRQILFAARRRRFAPPPRLARRSTSSEGIWLFSGCFRSSGSDCHVCLKLLRRQEQEESRYPCQPPGNG